MGKQANVVDRVIPFSYTYSSNILKRYLMKTVVVCMLFSFLILTGCGASVGNQSKVFDYGGELGVVVGNTVKFYYLADANNWKEDSDLSFNLPNGYKNAFDFEYLGVVAGNTVRFYNPDYNLEKEESKFAFNLPNGYKSVFGLDREYLGIVVGNTVKFYNIENKWKEESDMAFNLPNGYKSVFEFTWEYLGVVVGNTVKFYSVDDNWKEESDMAFNLPNGYKNVFGFSSEYLAVVVGNTVKFYDPDDKWKEVSNIAFTIPSVSRTQGTTPKPKSTNKLSGVYESDGDTLLESIEFEEDGTCYTVDSVIGFKQAMQYEVKGDKIIMIAGGASQPCFRIIDSNTIEGITTGFYGTYKKE
jgi:DUF2075 family protein